MNRKKYKILLALSDDDMRAGSSRSAAYLAHELNKHDFKVDLLVPKGKRSLILLDRLKLNYAVIRYYNWTKKIHEPCYMKLMRNVRQAFRGFYNEHIGHRTIKKIIEKGNYDLVVLNNTWVYLPAQVASEMGIPFVWHLREFNEEDHGWTFCDKEKSFSLMSDSAALIGISEAILNKYKPLIASDRFFKVYNGIDPEHFLSIERTPLSNQIVRIGIIGRISFGKGQIDLVRALASIKNECSPFRLYVAGEGSLADESALKKTIHELGMDDFVVMLGGIDDVAGFYESIDILVICSKMEAFGRVAVEGLMSGCIVIASNTGGLTEIIYDRTTGYFFEQGNIDQLSETILEVVRHKQEAQEIAKNGRLCAARKFTSAKNAEDVSSIYFSVLQNHKKGDNVK